MPTIEYPAESYRSEQRLKLKLEWLQYRNKMSDIYRLFASGEKESDKVAKLSNQETKKEKRGR